MTKKKFGLYNDKLLINSSMDFFSSQQISHKMWGNRTEVVRCDFWLASLLLFKVNYFCFHVTITYVGLPQAAAEF